MSSGRELRCKLNDPWQLGGGVEGGMAVDSAGDWGWDVVEDSVGDCRGGHGQVCLEF